MQEERRERKIARSPTRKNEREEKGRRDTLAEVEGSKRDRKGSEVGLERKETRKMKTKHGWKNRRKEGSLEKEEVS